MKIQSKMKIEKYEEISGKGISGIIDNHLVKIGSNSFTSDQALNIKVDDQNISVPRQHLMR